MSGTSSHATRVVRPASSWKSRIAICLLAFIATGAMAHRLSSTGTGSATRYRATARVLCCLSSPVEGNGEESIEVAHFDAVGAEQELVSDESLHRALRRLPRGQNGLEEEDSSTSTGGVLEQVRQNLRVSSTRAAPPNQVRLLITYTDEDQDRAIQLANALAESYAEKCRVEREKACAKSREARDAAERARQAYLEVQAGFREFLDGHFLRQRTLAEQLAKRRPGPSSAAAGQQPESITQDAPTWIEDPEWVELGRQLKESQRRRDRLLSDRTPLHPLVQDAEMQIARLKHRLAQVAEQIFDEGAGPAPWEEEPATDASLQEDRADAFAGAAAKEFAEAVETYETQKTALDRAEQQYDHLGALERQALNEQFRIPNIKLELAETCEVGGPTGSSTQPLLLALMAALTAAVGAVLISGFGADQPLLTPDQVERVLSVPVVGSIPATEPLTEQRRASRRRTAGKLARAIFGVLLIAVCVGVLLLLSRGKGLSP